jgi:hypothetical protein
MVAVDKILEASAKHPKPAGMVFQYGTAGVRCCWAMLFMLWKADGRDYSFA